jgi:ferredoxin
MHRSPRSFAATTGTAMLELLDEQGFEVIGPRRIDGVIAYAPVDSFDDLPIGVTDRQMPGRYSLHDTERRTYFGTAVGPHSMKHLLHPASSAVWDISRADDGALSIEMHQPETTPRAVLGVRPCEIAALEKQDRVLLGGPHIDPAYAANRAELFIIAVNCNEPSGTCFCVAVGGDPTAESGFDILLTEVPGEADPEFIAVAGTDAGARVLASLHTDEATAEQLQSAEHLAAAARDRMRAEIDLSDAGTHLKEYLGSEMWAEIGERCLACGNCTMSCPTCFCTDLVDTSAIDPSPSRRTRVWDSCFTESFSHMGPGPVRASIGSRYRQWLVHKFSTWHDQFGESGCVGCGRCITWCPVGIDVRREVARLTRSHP